jgi:hypothetical protein
MNIVARQTPLTTGFFAHEISMLTQLRQIAQDSIQHLEFDNIEPLHALMRISLRGLVIWVESKYEPTLDTIGPGITPAPSVRKKACDRTELHTVASAICPSKIASNLSAVNPAACHISAAP